MIRILLADDQPLVRTGFRMILDAEPDMEVIAEAGDGADAVRQARQLRPDVVVMDIRMPVQDGIAATAEIAAAGHARVLVLTTFHVDEHVVGALRAGRAGSCSRTRTPTGCWRRSAWCTAATPSWTRR